MSLKDVNFPEQLKNLPIECLDLSVRSYNALKRNRINTVGQLVLLSQHDLLEFEAFGAKSLWDVERAINLLLDSHRNELGVNLAPAQVEFPGDREPQPHFSRGGWLCPQKTSADLDAPLDLLDLSARPRNVFRRLRIKTVRQLVNFSKKDFSKVKNIGRTSVAEIQLKLLDYLSGAPLAAGPIIGDQEKDSPVASIGTKAFVESVLSRLPERQRAVIADRYGLWDGIAETLQDIGNKLGVTRERIRQIEEKGLARLQRVFRHRLLPEFVQHKLGAYITQHQETCGCLSGEEVVLGMADDCSVEEAAAAVSLLHDIGSANETLFIGYLIVAEPDVYCQNSKVASDYKALLERITSVLQKFQKPIPENELRTELFSSTISPPSEEEASLLIRTLAISPSVMRLRGGQVGLVAWTEFKARDACTLAEAALRLIARPAHFREITEKMNTLLESPGKFNERTIQQAIWRVPHKFVWTKSGTYGLAAWGISRPPFLKDRLIELLSEALYPLPYWYLHEKALEVCNCKEASIRMTLDLNPKIFKKFDGDQYGLRKHFNH